MYGRHAEIVLLLVLSCTCNSCWGLHIPIIDASRLSFMRQFGLHFCVFDGFSHAEAQLVRVSRGQVKFLVGSKTIFWDFFTWLLDLTSNKLP